jgi:hypothetical protein
VTFGGYVPSFQRNILPQSSGKSSSVSVLTACSGDSGTEFVGDICNRDLWIVRMATIVYD